MKQNLAIIFGGKSPEHEVSIITALQVMENVDKDAFALTPIYIAKDGKWYTGSLLEKIETYKNLQDIGRKAIEQILLPDPTKRNLTATQQPRLGLFKRQQIETIDVIFPCFHGGLGEMGGFSGLFEIAEIPYVGNGILGAALSMDKVVMKQLFSQEGIPITKYMWFYRKEWEHDQKDVLARSAKLTFPLFVKPANGGSSIGVSKVKNEKELEHAIEVAALFDRKIIVEEAFPDSREINISVIGNTGDELLTSVCEEVFSANDLLTFEDKYIGGNKSKGMASTKRKIPADLSKEVEDKIIAYAKKTFEVLDNNGLARIDFLVDDKRKEVVVLELNNLPGSAAYYLWEATNMSFTKVITHLVDLAQKRFAEKSKDTTTFSSNILAGYKQGSKTGK